MPTTATAEKYDDFDTSLADSLRQQKMASSRAAAQPVRQDPSWVKSQLSQPLPQMPERGRADDYSDDTKGEVGSNVINFPRRQTGEKAGGWLKKNKQDGEEKDKKQDDDAGEASLKMKITKPARMALARILQGAWLSVIDSFGLSLIWINIHYVMSLALPSIFCPLGEEWLIKTPGSEQAMESNMVVKAAEEKAHLLEMMLLIAVDFIIFGLLLALLVILLWLSDNIVLKTAAGGQQVLDWVTGFFD